MKKVIDDILKYKGKYSLKRIISAITFIYVINLSVYVSMTEKPNGVGIVASLLAFLTSLLAIKEISKKFADKTEEIKTDNE
jgi:hypothetical protein